MVLCVCVLVVPVVIILLFSEVLSGLCQKLHLGAPKLNWVSPESSSHEQDNSCVALLPKHRNKQEMERKMIISYLQLLITFDF